MNTKTRHVIGYTGTAILAIGIGTAGASGSGDGSSRAAPASTATVTRTVSSAAHTVTAPAETITVAPETVTASPEPSSSGSGPARTIPGDGTYEVGVDISPGRYTSPTPDSGNCYWARLSGSDGFDSIIDNNNSSGQSVVTIKASDKFFEVSGCNEWTAR